MEHAPTRICVVDAKQKNDSDHWKADTKNRGVQAGVAPRMPDLPRELVQEAHEAAVLQPCRSSYHCLGWVSLRRVSASHLRWSSRIRKLRMGGCTIFINP